MQQTREKWECMVSKYSQWEWLITGDWAVRVNLHGGLEKVPNDKTCLLTSRKSYQLKKKQATIECITKANHAGVSKRIDTFPTLTKLLLVTRINSKIIKQINIQAHSLPAFE
jgi:hypothetical protein